MSSAKGKFARWFGGLFLQDTVVTEVSELGSSFRRIDLSGPPRATAGWQAGDKVQVLFPSDDVRTFTPTRWTDAGATTLLVHLRAEGTASAWARGLAVGQPVRFVGPQRSLRMAEGPVVLVGDETSIGVAASYAAERPGQVAAVLEVGEDVDPGPALLAVGLGDAAVVRRRAGDAHHADLVAAVLDATGRRPAAVGITGGGDLIRGVRAGLAARGVRDAKVKAYWVPGKVALD